MAGLQHAGIDASIVWFDTHGDVQTLETTASGYVGGMPLPLLFGYRRELIADRLRLRAVPERRAVLVDARSLDPPEVDYLATSGIHRCGLAELFPAVLPTGPLPLHLDLDVIHPIELPGLRFPAAGGPTASAVLDAARRVLDTGRVVGLSLGCTWHPGAEDGSRMRARLLSALLPPGPVSLSAPG